LPPRVSTESNILAHPAEQRVPLDTDPVPGCCRHLLRRRVSRLALARARDAKRRPRVALKLMRKGRCLKNGPNHADAKSWTNRILDAFGTTSPDFLTTEVARVNNALDVTGEDGEARINAALAVIDGIRPRNEVEAMLASRMAVTHALAMEVLGRSKRVKDIEQFDSAANAANKLLRNFAMQAEVLANMRRGGKQSMQIRHVHVHAGGRNLRHRRDAAGCTAAPRVAVARGESAMAPTGTDAALRKRWQRGRCCAPGS
jgi:hypothetical protein